MQSKAPKGDKTCFCVSWSGICPTLLVEMEGFLLRKRCAMTNPQVGFSSLIPQQKPAGGGLLLWRWRDSNPRPNVELMCFLRAYFQVGFRTRAGMEPPTRVLSPKVSEASRSSWFPIPDIPAPPVRLASENGQPGDVSSLQLLRR